MTLRTPILQFGTGRFLQAHIDLFVSEALECGEALGPITVVQTTDSPASIARVAALAEDDGYPVRIRGLVDGHTVDRELRSRSVRRALAAGRDWSDVRRIAVDEAEVIVSNTGERGFALHPDDDAGLITDLNRVPRSFPAKLVVLLHARWQARPDSPLSVFPCELITRNGDVLRGIAGDLARSWRLPASFQDFLVARCRWANTLVDRIVSEPIEPIGAVAEPYALCAVERQDGLQFPCRHDAIVVTDDLARYARFKLHILNLGHTILAEQWLNQRRRHDETVLEAMKTLAARDPLESIWAEEVLPVFAAEGLDGESQRYRDEVRERFLNPFLAHRLRDIAQNHVEKKRRRLEQIVASGQTHGIPQPRLRSILDAAGLPDHASRLS